MPPQQNGFMRIHDEPSGEQKDLDIFGELVSVTEKYELQTFHYYRRNKTS